MGFIDEVNLARNLDEIESMRVRSMLTSNELLLERDQALRIVGILLEIGDGKFNLGLVTKYIASRTNISEERVLEILSRAKATLPG